MTTYRTIYSVLLLVANAQAFSSLPRCTWTPRHECGPLFMNGNSEWNDRENDSNKWGAADSGPSSGNANEDWQEMMARKQDGSFWSSFEPSEEGEEDIAGKSNVDKEDEVDEAETWLSTLAAISAEEVEFNLKEADRADKARQMQEWGFDSETITNTLGVATDDSLETADDVDGMEAFREDSYLDDTDWKNVESHTKVEKDPDTGEPIRQQMVYVDEHTCIGCTNCAGVAQSTFFMEDEYGRARVFQQWGDDDETIAIAIETCPVDCIHYVPYDELVELEKGRRGITINYKARLVNQQESVGLTLSHAVGGPNAFTPQQKISGNMGSRCNNCPSQGCKNCPMFGVGKNPEFERKEKERKERIERRRLQQERAENNKSAEL